MHKLFTHPFCFFCLAIPLGFLTLPLEAQSLNNAQNEDPDGYRQLENNYRQGRIYQIGLKEASTIKNVRNQIEAYRLTTLAYLYRDEDDSAARAMEKLLRQEPTYQIRPEDPPEFRKLFRQFQITPYWYGVRAGANVSLVEEIRQFSLNRSDSARGNYSTGVGYQLGLVAVFPLGKAGKLALVPGLQYAFRSYEYEDEILTFTNIKFLENQHWLEIPLTVRYFPFSKKSFFLSGGLSPSWLLATRVDLSRRTSQVNDVFTSRSADTTGVNFNAQRESFQISALSGLGLHLQNILLKGTLELELRFQYGLNSLVRKDARYENQDLIFRYNYIDNDFKVHYLNFSVAYLLPDYRIKRTIPKY
ncbi:MAG: PorT family protein [Bacteroidia bacterium]|nr:PorT family protein [Bacteroidia bacterium]